MARPRRESDKALIKDVDVYLAECEANHEIPQVIRFARRHGLTKQGLYYRANQSKELLDSIKVIIDEKQLVLEEGALFGQLNSTMAIFSLKQLGWKDKPEVIDEDDEETTGVILIPNTLEAHEPEEEDNE